MNSRIHILKLQPNQDLTDGIRAYLHDNKLRAVRIVDAVGSLVHATLIQDQVQRCIEGPGLEIAGLSGTVSIDDGSRLHGYVCKTDTNVAEGILVQGQNAVGVTFEIVLEVLG